MGDTIFPGSCGRLDLPDSDVSAMFDSLQVLRTLPEALILYPGHGYSGPKTTVEAEKRTLQVASYTSTLTTLPFSHKLQVTSHELQVGAEKRTGLLRDFSREQWNRMHG